MARLLPDRWWVAISSTVCVTTLACGGRAGIAPLDADPSGRCVVAATASAAPRPDTIVVALRGPVDPAHAPVPRNDAERLLFRHLYETLTAVDCEGRIQPRLAERWLADDDSLRWTFVLRADARFWDGAAVAAEDVLAGWGDEVARRLGTTVRAVGDSAIVIDLAAPRRAMPSLLAAPLFAVRKPTGAAIWPLGTGPFRRIGPATGGEIVIRATAGETPVIRFRTVPPSRDARDLLDSGIDVLLVSRRSVLEYVTGRSEFAAVALPWNRTYVLLAAGAIVGEGRGRGQGRGRSLGAALARDAVRVDARAAKPPFWWERRESCESVLVDARPRPLGTAARIAYRRSDPVARALAERLVAVSAMQEVAAVGVAAAEYDRSLAAGAEHAYVVGLPRHVLDPCSHAVPGWVTHLVPLIDTRSWLVTRRNVGPIAIEWDGIPRIEAGR